MFARRLTFLAVVLVAGPALAQSGPARVIDGDTMAIGDTRIRLYGIDAPESGQTCLSATAAVYNCGAVATMALEAWTAGKPVTCEAKDTDRYGRTVAICRADGWDLGRRLVAEGLAVAYARYSKLYLPEHDAARAARRGLWAGRFAWPWAWRRDRNAPMSAH